MTMGKYKFLTFAAAIISYTIYILLKAQHIRTTKDLSSIEATEESKKTFSYLALGGILGFGFVFGFYMTFGTQDVFRTLKALVLSWFGGIIGSMVGFFVYNILIRRGK